jgi:hypothetical protein
MSIRTEAEVDRARAANDQRQYDEASCESEEDLRDKLDDIYLRIECEIEDLPEVKAIREKYSERRQELFDKVASAVAAKNFPL